MAIGLTLSKVLIVLFVIAIANYLALIAIHKMQNSVIIASSGPSQPLAPGMAPQREGFTDTKSDSKETFLTNDTLYDSFYASVYDQLTQQQTRTAAKVALIMQEWKQKAWKAEQMIVLDAGCGTGVAAAAFAKMKVKQVLALDKSAAMIEKAKFGNQKNPTVTFRVADLNNPSAVGGGEVTHAACLYFTLYYLPDKDAFFRHMFLWVKPGGELVVEVVNKYKFDPMLESASPLVGFSMQKYSKKRITESNVVFDKFNYTGRFDLYDPQAEFTETFRFKDGKVRRQKHKFTMPTMEEIVKLGQAAGWVYLKYIDLVTVGFEYSYLLFFRHP
jgi:ubiquinone/menaquinone biosynthesis C-methylase UbiE